MKNLRTRQIKEALKIETLKEVEFYKGMVMTLDTYRRKGGYFGQTANHFFGIFFTYKNEVYQMGLVDGAIHCIVSARKKNFVKTWVNINYDSFNKI